MKLIISSILLILSNRSFAQNPQDIFLQDGDSITIGRTTVSCESSRTPTSPRPRPGRNEYGDATELTEFFLLGSMRYSTSLRGNNAYISNLRSNEFSPLGCCLIKAPKVHVFQNTPYVFGVGTDNKIYYKVGLNQGAWQATGGILHNQDDMIALNLSDSFIIFALGMDGQSFFSIEFNSRGLVSGWSYLHGTGPKIISATRLGQNDYRLIVEGTDGRLYSRTRNTSFGLL